MEGLCLKAIGMLDSWLRSHVLTHGHLALLSNQHASSCFVASHVLAVVSLLLQSSLRYIRLSDALSSQLHKELLMHPAGQAQVEPLHKRHTVQNKECMCRQEWQRQQPLRSASPQRVAKMAACAADAGFWVDGPDCREGPSLYLSRSQKGILQLLDASAAVAQPLKLALKTHCIVCAFMGRDGMLRIVEGGWSTTMSMQPLAWHTIDPSSGKTVASITKHSWPSSSELGDSIYHAAAHQALGMVGGFQDKRTLAVMEADTLTETFCLALTPSQGRVWQPPLHPGHRLFGLLKGTC